VYVLLTQFEVTSGNFVQGLSVDVCSGPDIQIRVAQCTACRWLFEGTRCGTFWLCARRVVGISSQYYVYLELQPCTMCR